MQVIGSKEVHDSQGRLHWSSSNLVCMLRGQIQEPINFRLDLITNTEATSHLVFSFCAITRRFHRYHTPSKGLTLPVALTSGRTWSFLGIMANFIVSWHSCKKRGHSYHHQSNKNQKISLLNSSPTILPIFFRTRSSNIFSFSVKGKQGFSWNLLQCLANRHCKYSLTMRTVWGVLYLGTYPWGRLPLPKPLVVLRGWLGQL